MAKKRAKRRKASGQQRTYRAYVPSDQEILNADAAADVLGISKVLLLRLARDGEIPGRKVGRAWRFHRTTLRKWIAGDSEVDQLINAMTKQGHKVTKRRR